jgi:DNA-binding NarL/FixJ family response regulator
MSKPSPTQIEAPGSAQAAIGVIHNIVETLGTFDVSGRRFILRVVCDRFDALADQVDHAGADTLLIQKLTRREREVFGFLVECYSNDEIAAALFIGVKTVQSHREHIMKKLDVHSLPKLIRLALSVGILAQPTHPSTPSGFVIAPASENA